MFCPKCGSSLTWQWDAYLQRDVFYCVPGDMPTSVNLTERLLERFGTQAPAEDPDATPPYLVRWQGGRRQWYCPGCGVHLHDDLRCGRCGRCGNSLHDLQHALIELHPHRGEWPPEREQREP
jgi:uncharacterized paraquat-inducible protein A